MSKYLSPPRILIALLLGVALVMLITQRGSAQTTTWPRQYVNNAVAVTQTSQTVNFGFYAQSILVVNDGSNELFFTLSSGTATTTTGFRVNAGETFALKGVGLNGTSALGIIASTGETTTARIGAWR
jgi:hypothetical protein